MLDLYHLFETGMEMNEKSWKVVNLEKDGRAKVDRIKELEHKVTRLEAMNDSARYQITQLKYKVEIQ